MLRQTAVTLQELRADGDYRHWCPESEAYAPAVVLTQYLRLGWNLDTTVGIETFFHAGYRSSDLYYFTVERDGQTVDVPVLANPVVFNILNTFACVVVPVKERILSKAPVR